MKKKLLGILILFFLFGCGKKDNKEVGSLPSRDDLQILTCTLTQDANGISYKGVYSVTYYEDIVTRVESKEITISDNHALLEEAEDAALTGFAMFDNIKEYTYTASIKENQLTLTTDIDYSKISIDELLTINPSLEILIKDGKISLESLVAVYREAGMDCKK